MAKNKTTVNTVSTTGEAVTAYATLTPAAREFMALVGHRRFDFFDDGIEEHSGNWGSHMTWQAAEMLQVTKFRVAGIQSGLAASPLWLVSAPQPTNGNDGKLDTWWTLTALGAEVAKLAAQVLTDVGVPK